MHVIDIVIFVCWAVFWLGWVAAAFGNKAGQSQWRRFAAFRIGIFLIIFLALRAGVFRGNHAAASNPWLQGAGLAVFLTGLALAVWARVYIGRNWGMPMTQKQDPELITSGPYRRVRHPIYSGIILAMTGTAIAVSVYWLVAMVLIGAYFIYSATVEERFMVGRFPDTYPAYKHSTKMLIPFVL
jgi:protein-S-isoprenylcysteine O-methyltransferase Ste14